MAGQVNKTDRLYIRISEKDKQMIQESAKEAGLSMTDYILRLVVADKAKNK